MLDLAVTLWVYALMVTAVLFTGVVVAQVVIRALRRSVRHERTPVVVPAPRASLETDRRVAA